MKLAARDGYLDELGSFFAAHGLPPMAGRLVAHLLVCEPAAQSFEELCDAVGASRATVSTMTRLLETLGLVERRPGAGRKLAYVLPEDAWTRLLEDDLRSASRLRELARKGRAVTPPRSSARSRLDAMEAFYAFLEQETARTLAAWKKKRRRT